MKKKFDYESDTFLGLKKVGDYILLNILWILFSTPIITIGASTSALYYSVNKVIRHGNGRALIVFWEAFKTNFKQSTAAWLILCGIYAITLYGYSRVSVLARQSTLMLMAAEICLSVFVVLLIWGLYLFPYISRFICSFKDVLKNSFLISIHNLHWSVFILLILVAACLLIYLFPILIFVAPICLMRIMTQVLERVFRKYMSKEELEAEDGQ